MPLRDEIQQGTASPASLHEEAYLSVVRTACILADRYSEFFKKHGLTDSQYNVLRILSTVHPEGLSCSDIAARMIHRDPDVTRLCDRMVPRGLVQRSRSTQDRRVVTVRITEAGLSMLASMQGDVNRITVSLLDHLEPEEMKKLIQLLLKARKV